MIMTPTIQPNTATIEANTNSANVIKTNAKNQVITLFNIPLIYTCQAFSQ